jgi:hypothetical protein
MTVDVGSDSFEKLADLRQAEAKVELLKAER